MQARQNQWIQSLLPFSWHVQPLPGKQGLLHVTVSWEGKWHQSKHLALPPFLMMSYCMGYPFGKFESVVLLRPSYLLSRDVPLATLLAGQHKKQTCPWLCNHCNNQNFWYIITTVLIKTPIFSIIWGSMHKINSIPAQNMRYCYADCPGFS